MARRFEYKSYEIEPNQLLAQLNDLGADGWQLVNLRYWQYSGSALAGPPDKWIALVMKGHEE